MASRQEPDRRYQRCAGSSATFAATDRTGRRARDRRTSPISLPIAKSIGWLERMPSCRYRQHRPCARYEALPPRWPSVKASLASQIRFSVPDQMREAVANRNRRHRRGRRTRCAHPCEGERLTLVRRAALRSVCYRAFPDTADELKSVATALQVDPSKVLHLGKAANEQTVRASIFRGTALWRFPRTGWCRVTSMG